jgi:hypothetical protein
LNRDDFKFVSIESKPAVKPGDNYMAILFRSKVEIKLKNGEERELSYIVKCLLSTVYNEKMVTGYSAFPKEKKTYSFIIPEFEKLYKEVGEEVTFGPKCYFESETPTQLIVLEDLSNYQMVHRSIGLDQNHIKEGLAWLGKFHAASMVYRERNGDYGDDFKTGIFTHSMEPVYQSYYNGYFDYYIEALQNLPNGEKLVAKAEKFRGILFSKICQTLDYDENAFNVLCHVS